MSTLLTEDSHTAVHLVSYPYCVAARIPLISDCNPRCGFRKRLDRHFNYQTRFLKAYCFSWPVSLHVSLPICPISQARSAEALFWRDRTRRRSVGSRIVAPGEARESPCERRRNCVSFELAYRKHIEELLNIREALELSKNGLIL